jgi:hypothetical protein
MPQRERVMLTVSGKIESAKESSTGKSVSVKIGGTYVSVAREDLEAFKDIVGQGRAVPVQVRTSVEINSDGTVKIRTFKKRDGTMGSGPDTKYNLWFKGAGKASGDLAGLLGVDLEQE